MNNELYHYGILGMKWGVRKDRDRHNVNYSEKQRNQDRTLYGKRSEKRINRRLNEGHSILSARHYEVVRKKRRRTIATGATAVAGVLGSIGSLYVSDVIFNNGEGVRAVKNTVNELINNIR